MSLFDDAKAVVAREQVANASLLQRKLGISAGKAIWMLDELQQAGVVSPPYKIGGHLTRDVRVNPDGSPR